MPDIGTSLHEAVVQFWQTRQLARERGQGEDRGQRSAATSGTQLDGVIVLIVNAAVEAGAIDPDGVKRGRRISVLPGYFRPEKEWDLVFMKGNQLGAVIELKSHIGPSFGNNFNNRAEEALGNATDFWTAYRERAFVADTTPWVGYFMLLEDHERARTPVSAAEPLFNVRTEFRDASYMMRYELLLRRLRLERQYSSTTLVTSTDPELGSLKIDEPAQDLAFEPWLRSLIAHLESI